MGLLVWISSLFLLHEVASQIYLPCNIIPLEGCSCRDPERPIVRCQKMGLKKIPKVSDDDTHTLDFSYNDLAFIRSSSFTSLNNSHLRRIFLDHNNIRKIKQDAFKPVEASVQWIDLSENSLLEVPKPFRFSTRNSFEKLTVLNLAGNRIHRLQNNLLTLPRLKKLFLDRNPINTINQGIWSAFPDLWTLGLSVYQSHISEDPFKVTDLELGRLMNLQALRLSGAEPVMLPLLSDYVSQIMKIKYLELHDMNFEDYHFRLGVFSPRLINQLVSLSLRNNNLTKIPSQILSLKALKHLDLSGNKIKVLSSSQSEAILPSGLEEVRLANNTMSHISSEVLLRLPNAKIIDLRDNNLHSISWTFEDIQEDFNPEMVLELGGNPWKCYCVNRWLRKLVQQQLSHSNGHIRLYEIYHTLYCYPNTFLLVVDVPMKRFECGEINEIDNLFNSI